MRRKCVGIAAVWSVSTWAVSVAHAAPIPLILNGGFETGLTGWMRLEQAGSQGTFFPQAGTASPATATPVPPPTEGAAAAMADASGPGTHVMYQNFVVPPVVVSATLQFDRYVNNHAGAFHSPDHLNFATAALNQQARVDLLAGGADPFSVAPADVILTFFRTQPGDPLVSGYTTVTADLGAVLAARAGETLRLRFAEVDNVDVMNFGVDRVRLTADPVPEPGSAACLALSACALASRRRMRPVT